MPPYAFIRPAFISRRPYLALATLLCAAGMVAPGSLRPAWAQDCLATSDPENAAGTSALYGELARSVNAEPLSVDIAARAISGSCTWVYEVKVLTASGSVALLDFDLVDLGLRRVEGAAGDPEVAKLMTQLTQPDLTNEVAKDGRTKTNEPSGSSGSASGGDDGGDDDSGSEGGSGSDGSGSEGGDGGSGSGHGGGGEGGSGGGSGHGGGEGGEGGGN